MSDSSFGLSPPLFDICLNLDNEQFDKDREEVLHRARINNVTRIALTGCSLASSQFAIKWAERSPLHYCATAGIHPHGAEEASQDVMLAIEGLLSHPQVKAVGECGLDYNRNFSSPSAQKQCFETHIALAHKHNMPLFLHQRDAHEDFMAMMNDVIQPAVVHCFTDTKESLFAYLDRGWSIGITGWICDPIRGEELRALVQHIPLERIMIETDAPWLFPKNVHPKPKKRRNEPSYLPHILSVIAEQMNVSASLLAQHSFANACSFFGMNTNEDSLIVE